MRGIFVRGQRQLIAGNVLRLRKGKTYGLPRKTIILLLEKMGGTFEYRGTSEKGPSEYIGNLSMKDTVVLAAYYLPRTKGHTLNKGHP